jgi:hypothetical protein
MWPFTKKILLWEPRFFALAQYNAEVSRGIIHTDEWQEKMHRMQNEYDAKVLAHKWSR